MPAGAEGGLRDRGEVALGPGGAFGAFEDDGVAGEEGGYYRAQEVVELGRGLACGFGLGKEWGGRREVVGRGWGELGLQDS